MTSPCETDTSPLFPQDESLTLPLIGQLTVQGLGLPLFTFTIGLLDGFNPCSMWVSLFMISMSGDLPKTAERWLLLQEHSSQWKGSRTSRLWRHGSIYFYSLGYLAFLGNGAWCDRNTGRSSQYEGVLAFPARHYPEHSGYGKPQITPEFAASCRPRTLRRHSSALWSLHCSCKSSNSSAPQGSPRCTRGFSPSST